MAKPPEEIEVDVKVRSVELEGLVLRPGDRLLIRVDPATTVAEVDALRRQLAEHGLDRALIIAAEQIAIERGGQ